MDKQHESKTDHELLEAYNLSATAAEEIRQTMDVLEDEIHSRMRERRATAIPSEKFVCEIKHTTEYDKLSLGPTKLIFKTRGERRVYYSETPELE